MISIVIPAYNEEVNISIIYNQIKKVMGGLKKDYEIIFVDDGSRDNTFRNIENLHKKDKIVKCIRFRRNFGQTAAMDAGIRNSNGDIIITMDADLQNDPNDIPSLLRKLDEGYDLVNGWRYKRKDTFLSKRLPSLISNWLVRKLTKLRIHDQGCTLRAIRKNAVKDLRLYGEMHRFIPALVAMNGFKVTEVKVSHHPRRFGKTKYSFNRIIKGLLDLLYIKFWSTYSTRPLHFFGSLGFIQYIFAGLIFIEQIIKAFIIGRLNLGPLFLVGILLVLNGTLFIMFGFLGEILIRAYYKSEDINQQIEKVLK